MEYLKQASAKASARRTILPPCFLEVFVATPNRDLPNLPTYLTKLKPTPPETQLARQTARPAVKLCAINKMDRHDTISAEAESASNISRGA